MNETENQIRKKMLDICEIAEKVLPDLNSDDDAKRENARRTHDSCMRKFDLLEKQLETTMSQAKELPFDDPEHSLDPGERAEFQQLMSRTSIGDYVRAATAGGIIHGAAKELNQAYGVPDIEGHIPINMLMRAATTTTVLDGPEMQHPPLPKLYEASFGEFLGVQEEMLPFGKKEWPILTTGATAATVAEGADAADPTAAAFTTVTLKPKRYQAGFSLTQEMIASIGPNIEPALRMNLQSAYMDLKNDALLSGTGADPQGTGLETRLTQPAKGSATLSYKILSGIPSQAVDAVHASHPSQVRVLIGLKTLEVAEGLFESNIGESGFEKLVQRSGGVRVSAKINPPPSSGNFEDSQDCFLYAAGDGMRAGDSVCAIWNSIQLIRDYTTAAKSGTINLHLIVMMDFYMALREGAYKRLTLKLA